VARNQYARRPPSDDRTREPIAPHIECGIEIARRPVDQWRGELERIAEPEREQVREYLRGVHAVMKQHAALDREIAEGRAVWIRIPKGFRK
jgi:hypothetical protein